MERRYVPTRKSPKEIKKTKDLFSNATEVRDCFRVGRFFAIIVTLNKTANIPIVHDETFNIVLFNI